MGFKADVDFKVYGKQVLSDLEQYATECGWTLAPSNYEGIRISFGEGEGDGWFLLRMSLHDPVLPINVESDTAGDSIKIVKDLYYFLRKYDFLDISPITDAINAWRGEKIEDLKVKFNTHEKHA